MVTKELINPKSIVVVGGSNDVQKPGGKILKNVIDGDFAGSLYVVNPKEDTIQGVKCTKTVNDLPQVDLAIIAIAAKFCLETVEVLATQKNTKAFIIISAGFSEESHEGKILEDKIVKIINDNNACLIGPNCTGVLTPVHHSIFTLPIPKLTQGGCDFITGSGATGCFILGSGVELGIDFSNVFTVGNSAQLGVEEILEYMDESFDPKTSSKIKLLYVENIKNPKKLLKHASSLIQKGCRIAAIKSGSSEAGSRAASSHTGALATSDVAVDALFRKAGIVRCYGRQDLATMAAIFTYPELKGKRIAIITHAGGPAVMLTDALEKGGLQVPHIEGPKADELLGQLFAGSSVANPIDFLATGTPEQLGIIIDYCNNHFDVDAIAVIFGTPGLTPIFDAYNVLSEKIKNTKKPIYPILPATTVAKEEIEDFVSKGHAYFPDEKVFGDALTRAFYTPKPSVSPTDVPQIDVAKVRDVISRSENGYIRPELVGELLDVAGVNRSNVQIVTEKQAAVDFAKRVGYPLVMKVVGPVHKSDVGGVTLNIKDEETVAREFDRLMQIKDTYAVEICSMYYGAEVFIGASRDENFGQQVFFGLGGIFIEVLKDVQSALAPIGVAEVKDLLKQLKGYKILEGVRGQKGVNIDVYADYISRISALVQAAPEIAEMDLNPLLGNPEYVVAVDARIRIEK